MFGIHRNFPAGGGGGTGDATAEQWEILSGVTAYIASGKVTGTGYFPAAMTFNGSTGYYSVSASNSGNLIFGVAKFIRSSFTGDRQEVILQKIGSSSRIVISIGVYSSDYSADSTRQNKLTVACRNSSNTNLCLVLSDVSVCDGAEHTVFFAFNATAGSVVLRIDGSDADDTGWGNRVLTTGTLESGSGLITVGAGAATAYFGGNIGYCGLDDSNPTWSDLLQTDGTPKPVDESGWTEFSSSQPLAWHEAAKMDENLGSAGAFTKNGTVTLASAQ